jgi:nitrous oxidase accessory protein
MRNRVQCPEEKGNKVMLVVAALLVFASLWLPYWQIHIVAPQYPKGLNVIVYVTGAGGDVREVDGLNHYIGMRPLGEAAPFERKIAVPGLSAIALSLGLLAFVERPRWLQILLALPVWAVPFVFAGDLYYWLREYGLNLDPKAPLSAMIKPFIPPLVGPGKVGQFQVFAWFHIGYFAVLTAGILTLVAIRRRLLCERRLQKVSAAAKVVVVITMLLMMAPLPASPREWTVAPGGSLTLQQAIQQAQPGDTIRVMGGEYRGNFLVDKTLTLVGEGSPVLNGEGRGSVIHLAAPRCVLRGFIVRNSGIILDAQDSGVRVSAPDCLVENNRLEKVLFGVHLQHAHRTLIRNNKIFSHDLPVARRGDQIRIWYSHHARIEGNQVVGGRDLVFWYSEGVVIRDNRVRECRYGVHFMYCSNSVVEGNHLEGNSVAIYIMYSENVRVLGNHLLASRGPSGMGLGIKDGYRLHIEKNLIADNRIGLFIDSGEGVYKENWFVRNDVGTQLVLAVKPNLFQGNRLVENIEQVRMDRPDSTAGVRWIGNFWSDYTGYDRDGDGLGETPYRAMKVFDQVAASNSALRLLSYSPSAQALDFGARLFPLFAPQSMVVDERPLMRAGNPPGSPASLPTTPRSHWLVASVALLGLGILSLRSPRAARHRPRLSPLQEEPQGGALGRFNSFVMARQPVIRVEGLSRRFGRLVAVDRLQFEVREGETLALWGANGAGKTTVLRCLLGLLRFEGEAQVLGYSVKREGKAVRQQVGYVPQLVHLHPDLSVQETAYFYAQLRGISPERADSLLVEWGLQEHREKPVSALSGGMKQKLALVLALLSDPPVLLLDEPTAHLDAAARAEWLELLRRLKAQGKTLLFCTHQFNEVRALADRVIVLERGRKVAELTGAQFVALWQRHGSLRLTVPPEHLERAQQILQEAGYNLEAIDGLIVVQHLEAKQVEPLSLLLRAGVEVLDYEWRPPAEPPDWTLSDELMSLTALTSSSESDAHPNPPNKGESTPTPSGHRALQGGSGLFRQVMLLMGKEMRDARRNRWFLMLMGLFVALSLLLTLFGLTGVGTAGATGFGRTFASLLNLSLLIVPLMGLLMGALSITVERDQQTLYTLLAQPLTPTAIVLGKFLGLMLTIGAAVLMGFGSSGLLIYMAGVEVPLSPFLAQLGLTLMLGWSCLAMGLLVSVLVKRGATAVGIGLLLWLALVFISDLGIIGTAIALQLKASTLLWLTLLNPLQVFKIAVIQLMEGNLEVLGSGGLYARDVLGDAVLPVLSAILSLWVVAPFLVALGWFTRRGAIE